MNLPAQCECSTLNPTISHSSSSLIYIFRVWWSHGPRPHPRKSHCIPCGALLMLCRKHAPLGKVHLAPFLHTSRRFRKGRFHADTNSQVLQTMSIHFQSQRLPLLQVAEEELDGLAAFFSIEDVIGWLSGWNLGHRQWRHWLGGFDFIELRLHHALEVIMTTLQTLWRDLNSQFAILVNIDTGRGLFVYWEALDCIEDSADSESRWSISPVFSLSRHDDRESESESESQRLVCWSGQVSKDGGIGSKKTGPVSGPTMMRGHAGLPSR